MNKLQSRVLNIMKFFHQFCIENDIQYFIMSGTMLGAIRHSGFIPWDDDIDVGMTQENYEKLIALADEFNNSQSDFTLMLPGTKNYAYNFIKILDNNSTLIDYYKVKKMALGFYIDVFEFCGIPSDKKKALEVIKKRNILCQLRGCAMSFRSIGSRRYWPFYFIGKIIGINRLLKKIKKIDSKFPYSKHEYVYDPDGRNPRGIIPKTYIEDGVELFTFEDAKFFGLKRYHEYLSSVYGDYMTLPNETQRYGHEFSFIDYNLSYQEYRKR